MFTFLSYLRDFYRTVHAGLLLFAILFTALIIFCNYRFGIEQRIIQSTSTQLGRSLKFYCLYLGVFSIPLLTAVLLKQQPLPHPEKLVLLVLAAPAVFALKIGFNGLGPAIQALKPGMWGRYWALVAKLPLKFGLVLALLLVIWRLGKFEPDFFGVLSPAPQWKPYLWLLLLMVPLIAWASAQPAFLHVYPKARQVAFIEPLTTRAWPYKLIYELSYGVDFITIELFFRGFLVLAFVRFLGQEAVIPMAVFYCSIHFGKPVAECVSSFFGGLLLGIIVYHTRSIAGGLLVHLGIAWMMEAGGWMGNIAASR